MYSKSTPLQYYSKIYKFGYTTIVVECFSLLIRFTALLRVVPITYKTAPHGIFSIIIYSTVSIRAQRGIFVTHRVHTQPDAQIGGVIAGAKVGIACFSVFFLGAEGVNPVDS